MSTTVQAGADVKPKAAIGPAIARVLLGLMFTLFGAMGLAMAFHMMKAPEQPMPEGAKAFNMALANSGYMMPLVSGTQFVVGVLLLFNRFVPLALAVLAPVLVNIVLFHLFLQPAGIVPGLVATALELYLAWSYRDAFRSMLMAKTVAG